MPIRAQGHWHRGLRQSSCQISNNQVPPASMTMRMEYASARRQVSVAPSGSHRTAPHFPWSSRPRALPTVPPATLWVALALSFPEDPIARRQHCLVEALPAPLPPRPRPSFVWRQGTCHGFEIAVGSWVVSNVDATLTLRPRNRPAARTNAHPPSNEN